MHGITIEIPFEAGHRIAGHQGKCSNIHGHSYKAMISFESESLNDLGMVADFGDLKRLMKEWIDKNWDHAMLVHVHDFVTLSFLTSNELKLFSCTLPPTAEYMAMILWEAADDLLKSHQIAFDGVKLTGVLIRETEKCFATYKR